MQKRHWGLFVLWTVLGSSGCSEGECSLVGCGTNSVQVEFSPPFEEAGRYQFRINSGEKSMLCELDFEPGADVVPLEGGCAGLDIRGSEVAIGDSVTEGSPMRIFGLGLAKDEPISLVIALDGEPLLDHSFNPELKAVEMNGEGCGECQMAIETISTK